jgi:hypothetical protein
MGRLGYYSSQMILIGAEVTHAKARSGRANSLIGAFRAILAVFAQIDRLICDPRPASTACRPVIDHGWQ